MGQRFGQATFLVLLMLLTPLSGCFGQQDGVGLESTEDVVITPPVLTGGVFQGVTITADVDLAVFVPTSCSTLTSVLSKIQRSLT